jgi:hypothetical protein
MDFRAHDNDKGKRRRRTRERARGDAAPMHLKLSPFARSLVCVYVGFLGRRYPAENASVFNSYVWLLEEGTHCF